MAHSGRETERLKWLSSGVLVLGKSWNPAAGGGAVKHTPPVESSNKIEFCFPHKFPPEKLCDRIIVYFQMPRLDNR